MGELLPEGTPMLDVNDKNFEKELEFALWSTQSSSDYRNDRERPYNGQRHTSQGERGKQIIEGLTMRDICDCIVQGFLSASCNTELQHKTIEINKEFIGTKHAKKNTWRYQDVYKISADIDPLAVVQNTVCFIEHYMGIYPNIEKLSHEK